MNTMKIYLFLILLLLIVWSSLAQESYAVSPEHPFGKLNPEAPKEVGDYAALIGTCDCVARQMRGAKPSNRSIMPRTTNKTWRKPNSVLNWVAKLEISSENLISSDRLKLAQSGLNKSNSTRNSSNMVGISVSQSIIGLLARNITKTSNNSAQISSPA